MEKNRSEKRNPAFGSWLRSAIKTAGMTQNEFADSIGVSKSSVSRWVNGDIPKGVFVEKIADVLVLGYDFVDTQVGYRPKELNDGDDVIKRELLPMMQQIDWSDELALAGMKKEIDFWKRKQVNEGRGQ